MSRIFKERRKKGSNVEYSSPSQNATASTSTSISTDQPKVAIEKFDWVLHIAGIIKDVSEGSQLLAPLKATCALIIRGLEITRDTLYNVQEWNAIAESLEKQNDMMQALVAEVQQGDRIANVELQSACETYVRVIQEVLTEATKPVKSSKPSVPERLRSMVHSVPVANSSDSVVNLKRKMDAAFEDFFNSALLVMSVDVTEFTSLVTNVHEQVMEKVSELRLEESAEEAYEDHSLSRLLYGLDIPVCLPGTRVGLLESIHQWSRETSVKEQIYWLKDAAGTGKTTVAATLTRDWMLERRLAGRFFFTPNSIASSGIGQFCIAVAKDIAKQIPSLEPTILQALEDFPPTHYGFDTQFQNLIIQPLRSLEPAAPILLVIDALDNCDPDGREELLHCILENLSSISHARFLITSRPSPDIVSILWDSNLVRGREAQLLDINDAGLTDIRTYISSTLVTFSAEQREQLVGYSGGLFIVAATACKLLRWNAEPAKLLSKLLHADKKDHLDELYLEVLRQAVSDPAAHEMMMNVLQIIIVAFQPISINTIRTFLPLNIEVDAFVQDLGAVLKDGNPDRPIKVLHPTFREFLTEEERANGFLMNTLSSHALIAMGCLSTLEKALDYDILHLQKRGRVIPCNTDVDDLDRKVMSATTAAVRYAASYWTYHVAACLEDVDIWLKTLHFLSTKLLNWIELMSWRGDLGDCVQGIWQLRIGCLQALRRQVSPLDQVEVAKITRVYQFLLHHQPIIQDSALHTYVAALAFTPEGSPILDRYQKENVSHMPRILSAVPTTWPEQDLLTGHTGVVREIEFSPDGNRLATRAEDYSLILWDTNSGAIVGRPFKDTTRDAITSLSFSPDGHWLAFSTNSSKIRIWNAVNGKQKAENIKAGEGAIVQIAFSPVHPYIISASKDPGFNAYKWAYNNNIQLWSTSNGERLGEKILLRGGACCFAVSPDSTRIASVSKPSVAWQSAGVVTLWSLESFLQLAQYDMSIVHNDLCVVYSPTGNHFASWDKGNTLYLYDGKTGEKIAHINENKNIVVQPTFSPNGEILAHGIGEDDIIYLRDAATGVLKLSLAGHEDIPAHLSFASDGVRLASVSWDQTVKLWNTETGESMESFFTGYTGDIYLPVLSPDWRKLVTVSTSHQLNLHDIEAGTMYGGNSYEEAPSTDFARPIVTFSPNGDTMACGFMDLNDRSELHLWSLETCSRVGIPMVGHQSGIRGLSFSPDASLIASVSEDSTVRIWDGQNGSPFGGPFHMHESYNVLFSADSKFIASRGSYEMKVWAVHTRECIWSIAGAGPVCTFSWNNNLLAGRYKGKLCLWRFSSGSITPVASTEGAGDFTHLAFDPMDRLLASSSGNKIQLWNAADELQLLSEISIRPRDGFKLGISLDSRFLAFGSLVWDISSLPMQSPVFLSVPEETVQPLDWRLFPHSLLTYHDGWIHCASPPGPLLPIPGDMQILFANNRWHAFGNKLVVWNQQRLPIIIDCESLLG